MEPTKTQKRLLMGGFAFTILFQLSVVGWEYLGSVWPLWFGEEITLKIEPVDPRSLFRGNYVQLNYTIGRVKMHLAKETFRRGEVAYVSLKKKNKFYVATKLQKERPQKGLFIRGRIVRVDNWSSRNHSYDLEYGIEAYFLPKEKALAEEKRSNEVRYATVFVLPNGRAAIDALVPSEGGNRQ